MPDNQDVVATSFLAGSIYEKMVINDTDQCDTIRVIKKLECS
jgi:hypothetical protein